MSAIMRKGAGAAVGRDDGEQRRGASVPAASVPRQLSAAPANDQRRPIDRSTRVIDMTWGELQDELRAAAQPVAPPPEVLTPAEACDLLRVSMSTLWRLQRDRLIKARLVSGSRRYLRRELMDFVELSHAEAAQ